jgi:phage tail sheath protein FI
VVPGYVPDVVRKRLEDMANAWGMLLIGDLRDEPNYRQLSDQFRTDGGAYEFLKRPEDKAASDVVLAGWAKLRDRHWFEEGEGAADDADLYAPPSLIFAGCLARTDRTPGAGIAQGPVGMVFGKVRGVERARIEPRIGQMEHLSMERQVVTIIRNEDNDLCFVGSRSQAEDPNGVLKFFTSYRVLRYLERRIAVYLRRVAEQRLTRDLVKEQVRNPVEDFLESERKKGTIYRYDLDIDMDEDKFAMGQLDIRLEVLPVGPAETFHLRIDTPNFRKKADA